MYVINVIVKIIGDLTLLTNAPARWDSFRLTQLVKLVLHIVIPALTHPLARAAIQPTTGKVNQMRKESVFASKAFLKQTIFVKIVYLAVLVVKMLKYALLATVLLFGSFQMESVFVHQLGYLKMGFV